MGSTGQRVVNAQLATMQLGAVEFLSGLRCVALLFVVGESEALALASVLVDDELDALQTAVRRQQILQISFSRVG